MKIKFKIKGQELIQLNKDKVANFVRHHLKCSFSFDENWMNLKKYAIFMDVEGKQIISELGYGQTLVCEVPEEITQGNFFRVSVFANELLTSTQETILLSPSGYTLDLDEYDMEEDGEASNTIDDEEYHKKRHYEEYMRVPDCKHLIRDEHPQD